MKLTKCIKNHYYDGDKYMTCPYCDFQDKRAGLWGENPVQGNPPESVSPIPPLFTPPEFKEKKGLTTLLLDESLQRADMPIFRKKGTPLIETAISQVQVYFKGCLVKRTGRLTLRPGLNEQYITGLTNTAQPSSVRLLFSTDAAAGLIQLYPCIPEEEVPEGCENEDEIIMLQEKLIKVKQQLQDQEELRGLWMKNALAGKKCGESLDGIIAYMEALPKRIEATEEEGCRLRETLRDLQGQLEKLLQEKHRQKKAHDVPCVFIQLFADQEVTCEVYSFV